MMSGFELSYFDLNIKQFLNNIMDLETYLCTVTTLGVIYYLSSDWFNPDDDNFFK